MPTAIIADDERLMREQLRTRLTEVWPDLQILAEAKNGEEAVTAVHDHHPDLAFLDIRMPGMTGIEAARHIGDACHVVFITAYNEYAVDAFEHGAVDYVLKPAEADRLAITVARLKKSMDLRFLRVDRRFAQIDGRFATIEHRLDRIERTIMVTKNELREEIDRSAADTRRHFEVVAESMRDDLRIFADAIGLHSERLNRHETRITQLEQRSF